jgi:hypothetical protein
MISTWRDFKINFDSHTIPPRASRRRLLLEEEDKLGHSIERLCNVQRHVVEDNHRIALQKAPIARRGADGKNVALAETALRNLIDIQQIFKQYRQILLN